MDTVLEITPPAGEEQGEVKILLLDAKTECPITKVTVYSDRADITRHLSTALEKGTTTLEVSGISHMVDPSSIRINGARGNATILEVSSSKSFTKKAKETQNATSELKDKLEELNKKIASTEQASERTNKENDWLEKLSGSMNFQKSNCYLDDNLIDTSKKFIEYYRQRARDISTRLRNLKVQLKGLQSEQKKYQSEMDKLKIADGGGIQEILITVSCKEKTQLDMEVAYVVHGATWSASYDIRVTSGEKKLDMTYYGNINNSSGEDWEGVYLILSTAQASIAGKPPELETKYVDFQHCHSSSSFAFSNTAPMMSQSRILSSPSSFSGGGGSRASVSAETATASAKESTTSVNFEIKNKSTIASDNKPHKVSINLVKLVAEFTYIVIPKLSSHVYLKASIKNTESNYVFLPGPINVFMDNNLVAKSDIPFLHPSESYGIFLGVAPGIKFEYQNLQQKVETQGFISRTRKLRVEYNIIVTNTSDLDSDLEIFDQLPKSNNSSIKVKLITPDIDPELEDGPETLTPANNIHWKRKIKKREKLEFPFIYEVEYPADKEIENAY